VIETLNRNTQVAQEAVRLLVQNLTAERECECQNALSTALITNPQVIPTETRERLGLLVNKYLK
jgi:5'-methylthioadenosine phosphorylase